MRHQVFKEDTGNVSPQIPIFPSNSSTPMEAQNRTSDNAQQVDIVATVQDTNTVSETNQISDLSHPQATTTTNEVHDANHVIHHH
ncbi:hypothetical protein K7432_004379 [Basidiobolus ranarum]|uniref:Uncharacterized protein n=1 Tax=Basidiobolus ranarum TaxID=34480 RepID=A0ABR2WYF5_9FUNG